MTKSPALLRQELRSLRRTFLAQLPDRVEAIEAAFDQTSSGGGIEHVDALFHLAHRLCGSAGIYGCPAVHAAADAIERGAEGLRRAGGKDHPRRLAELRQLVLALKRAAAEAGESAPAK